MSCGVQDWLMHPDVRLAAYLPFLQAVGIESMQASLRLSCHACCCDAAQERLLWHHLTVSMVMHG